MPYYSQQPQVAVPARTANKWRISQFFIATPEIGLPHLILWIVAEFVHPDGTVDVIADREYQAESMALAQAMMAPTTGGPIYFDLRDKLYAFAQEQGWIPAEAEYAPVSQPEPDPESQLDDHEAEP